jgi:SAM-dependent methyltransferase
MTESKTTRVDSELDNIAASYDRNYVQPNYFEYKTWLYKPFIKALVKKARLKKKQHLLDAGCGQGFFTSLFAGCGLKTLGVDISAEGISHAKKNQDGSGAEFEVGDVCNLPYENAFDCVYSRSCSLYNRTDFAENSDTSDALLKYVKPGGMLIFDYYTNPGAREKSKSWIYHSAASVEKHFSRYPGTEIYFSLRFDTLLLGRFSFSLSDMNILASRATGIGGDLIAIVPKK